MEVILSLSLLVNFLVGGYLVVMAKSPNNMLRTAAFLEAKARAQEEIRAAIQSIQDEARLHQRRREIQLLRQQDTSEKPGGLIELGK